jgi:hypothetical protein
MEGNLHFRRWLARIHLFVFVALSIAGFGIWALALKHFLDIKLRFHDLV